MHRPPVTDDRQYATAPFLRKPMSPPFRVTKVSDEGSSCPFIARVFFGLLKFRDDLYLLAINDSERPRARDHFDQQFKPMLEAAQAARDAALEIRRLVSAHIDAIRTGQAVRYRPNQYDILQTIDIPLSQAVDKLVDQGVVAVKTGLQNILRDPLGLEIGFLFQKDSEFEVGIADLQATGQPELASYLRRVRGSWLSAFLQLRVCHEHHGWSLGGVHYSLTSPSSVAIAMPQVLGLRVDEFAQMSANRILLLIENLVVYAMDKRCPFPIFVVEIPRESRNPMDPQRFRLAPRGLDPSVPWVISYADESDFV